MSGRITTQENKEPIPKGYALITHPKLVSKTGDIIWRPGYGGWQVVSGSIGRATRQIGKGSFFARKLRSS